MRRVLKLMRALQEKVPLRRNPHQNQVGEILECLSICLSLCVFILHTIIFVNFCKFVLNFCFYYVYFIHLFIYWMGSVLHPYGLPH